MTKPFEHEGRTYTFRRNRGTVEPVRDDGCTMYSTFPSLRYGGMPCYAAYIPAFATITEAKAAIMGRPQPTMVHMPVWAHDAAEAARIREEMDNGR